MDILEFLNNSKTAFHAVLETKKELDNNSFKELTIKDFNKLTPGKYYITRNDSSLIAFIIPDCIINGFNLMASHNDTPSFKIKPLSSLADNNYLRLNTEVYGAPIYSTWVDRKLSIAGRISYLENDTLKFKFIDIDKDLLLIPNLAIHLNREINKGYAYNPQIDLIPLASLDGNSSLISYLKDYLNLNNEILSYDLFLYNRDIPSFIGFNQDMISSPRIDDLTCVYATLMGFINSKPNNKINVFVSFDNEEVGSSSYQGAASDFLETVLKLISKNLMLDFDILKENSFMLSCDNGHAVNPNLPNKTDSVNNCILNKGIVIKNNGNLKYTTDMISSAICKMICKENKISYQEYSNRSDIVGGSTLGNISICKVSIRTADIGLAQLSMHSALETVGKNDITSLIDFSKAFYNSNIDFSCKEIKIK